MAYLHGKTFWGWVRLRDGRRKRVSLGTGDRGVAREIEGMFRQLTSKRDWALLEAAAYGPSNAGELYDSWIEGPDGLTALRVRLSDTDLGDYVDAWRTWARRRASESTVDRYLYQVRILIPIGKPFPRSQFTRKVITEALSKLPTSGSTARRYHAAWSSFAKYLVEIEVIEVNPLRSVTPPRNNPPKDLYLSLPEVKRLVDAQPEPYQSLAALREGAGVEISAALNVRRRDVDESRQTVHVHGRKNAWRDRPVFVEDWAWPYIKALLKGKHPDAPLFIEEDGEPASYTRARGAHQGAIKALKLPSRYTMHDARHSFAVRCMKAGVDPQVIANNLGHQDASMVLRVYGKYRVSAADFRRERTGTGG